MIDVKSKAEDQRLIIIADQALSPEDFQAMIHDVKTEAVKLNPGFVVAVDFRGMWVDDPFINEHIKLLQEALLAVGARKIGTLLDNPAVHMHLSQEGQRTSSNVITRRFYKEKEWEKFLSD